jgi:DNA topoisomerase II
MADHKKTVYIKQDPITHILTRPDMYVGSKSFENQLEYLWDQSIIRKEISISPALTRTFIEILSNAIDNFERGPSSSKMSYIKVNLSSTECEIVNDGAVIPIEYNESEKMYNHTLIFGHLLSGSNYDDSEKRYTSGRNGLGAKLTNVLSTSFTVEGVDPNVKQKFVQTWTNNMRATTGPVLTKSSRSVGYTSIKWKWDLNWFGIKSVSQDIQNLFAMYVLNAAMITGLNVQLNGEKLPNKPSKFFELFDGSTDILKLENDQSKVFVSPSTGNEFECFSFVNGIKTKNGGKHVNAWVEAVCRPVIDKLKGRSKKSEISLTLKDVKPFFKFLVITRISNPEFEGQEKNELKGPSVTATPISQVQVAKILKWDIGESLKNIMLAKEKKHVTKAIATINKHPSIDGYDRANNAGSVKSKECTLIVCEGLSAKTFAVEGISHGLNGKKGRDWFGIYPLRGKLLNTRNATPTSIKNNTVITNLMKIIGLDYGNPEKVDKLNYGKVCIITDADVDGIHIEGLILNFFHSLFPKLLKDNFVISMKTPILRITRTKEPRVTYLFDERTYNSYSKAGLKIKYFKGLGTTKAKDVKDIFGIKMLKFECDKDADKSFEIAFNKSESSERKLWLANYSPIDYSKKTLDDETDSIISFPLTRHLNDELIKFFHDDCKRSIPSGLDGLKESQRKIIFAAKKRNLTTETKVAQFGAYVAENTNYHHGEDNLFKTIIKMAQTFPGTNNIPLFMDEGMFGTRLEGGEDAASPRYIYTKINPAAFNKLFHPLDDCLLKQREDDGDLVEPYYYVPTIPLLLINGCIGIDVQHSSIFTKRCYTRMQSLDGCCNRC